MPPTTVLIADPRKTRRAACVSLLRPQRGIRVVAEARSGWEAISATALLKPHILLLALSLSPGNAVALLPVLRRQSPRTKVILLSGRPSRARALKGLCHGARGYLEQKGLRAFLPKAVRVVEAGEAWVPRGMVATLADLLATSERGSLAEESA